MSTGLIYKASSLADDTNFNTDDGYVQDMFDGELVLTQNLNEIVQMLWSACSDELYKKTDETENDETTYEFHIHPIINDVNNLFVFAQLDDKMIKTIIK